MTASLGPEASLLRAGAVLVNRDGRRFADELQPAGLAISRQPGGNAWLVFDETDLRLYRPWETPSQQAERRSAHGDLLTPPPGEWGGAR